MLLEYGRLVHTLKHQIHTRHISFLSFPTCFYKHKSKRPRPVNVTCNTFKYVNMFYLIT